MTELLLGLVTRAAGGFFFVHHGGQTYRCVARGRLRRTGRIVAGDRVWFRPLGADEGVVEAVEPRVRELVKPAAGDPSRLQVLAANVDQACVVFASASPHPEPQAVDRFLALAETCGLRPVVCFNKRDLGDPRELRALYGSVGYPVLWVSARTGEGLDTLREALRGHVNVFVGPSGVGKSSLLNALNPQARRKVGELGRKGRGRHTTTAAELVPVGEDAFVVDTPGVDVLAFVHLDPDAIRSAFPEIRRLAAGCAFPDCTHREEPGCAVREAAARGEVAPSRLRSYRALLEEAEEALRARYR
jgi:ribosome biogenesis GTPase